MATIVNHPTSERIIHERSDDSGAGLVVGILLAVLLAVVFFVFGLPYLRSNTGAPATENPGASAGINLNITPGTGSGGTGDGSGSGSGATQ